MGAPDAALARDVEAATRRLLESAADLDDAEMRAPSQLPDWSRGHVLTHVARNADGLVNLLGWSSGSRRPMYESNEARDHDIAEGAGRPAAELVADVRASADRFAAALEAVPDGGWDTTVELRGGRPLPTYDVPWKRFVEVELHHVDLGADYRWQDWPDRLVERLLGELLEHLPARLGSRPLTVRRAGDPAPAADQDGPVVTGTPVALTAWLTGRSAGDDLEVSPAGPVPELPAWL